MPENENSSDKKNHFEISSNIKDQVEYIADLLLELAAMARARKLHTLAVLIEHAQKEADLRSRD